jgi:Ca-activated chloride channel family protein
MMTGFFLFDRRWVRRPAAMAALTVGIALWGPSDFRAPLDFDRPAPSTLLFAQSVKADLLTDTGRGDGANSASATRNEKQNSETQVIVRLKPIHTMPIGIDVNMVVVNVTVTGAHDRIVTGLGPAAFEVYDNKVPQQIAAFSAEDAPVSVGLIFDSSSSMAGKIEKAKQAALQFFKTCNTQDEVMLINFNERPDLVGGFTSNFEYVQRQLIAEPAKGRTALLDAIYLGLEKMRSAATNRKALLVISDGGDNHSRYTESDVRRALQESDVEIYAVGVFNLLQAGRGTREEGDGPRLLGSIAKMSGGRLFHATDTATLPDIMKQISNELRNQYAIGYKPSDLVRDGRWRRVKVRVNPPRDARHLQVYARAGYYAPTQ